jgi:hypothetical protein
VESACKHPSSFGDQEYTKQLTNGKQVQNTIYQAVQKVIFEPDVVTHTYNPNAREDEAGG